MRFYEDVFFITDFEVAGNKPVLYSSSDNRATIIVSSISADEEYALRVVFGSASSCDQFPQAPPYGVLLCPRNQDIVLLRSSLFVPRCRGLGLDNSG